MKREFFRMGIGILAVVVIGLSSMAFTVRQEHTALVTRFGELKRTVVEPGLHWKMPWPVDRAVLIDGRTRVFNTRNSQMLTRDKKNIILLSYAVWKVAEPELFYKSVGSLEAADQKLDGLITNAKIGVLGGYDLSALVSTEPSDLKGDVIEGEILTAVNEAARSKYGVDIQDVGFKRISLPEENISTVFDQMRAERQSVAAGYRAQGEAEATELRSQTDYEVAEIRKRAEEDSAKVRGESEAEAAEIYSVAHNSDPQFFSYLRQLESIKMMVGEGTDLILRTDNAPFSLLNGLDDLDFETPLGGKPAGKGGDEAEQTDK